MALAARSLPTKNATGSSLAIVRWWHLLSLDAPTVAAVWALFFARITHLHLPWGAPLMLALGTWLVYVADRLLDGAFPGDAGMLRERHHFCAKHRGRFVLAGVAGGAVLLWMISTRMHFTARLDDTVLFGAAMMYFAAVHGGAYVFAEAPDAGEQGGQEPPAPGRISNNWLPKEAAVGILFAAATAVPAWSRLSPGWDGERWELILPVSLFAALCWLNCVAIEHWESLDSFRRPAVHAHATTELAGRYLRGVALAICGIALLLVPLPLLLPKLNALGAVFLAAAMSAMAIFALEQWRSRFSTMELRIAADAALLTPAIFLAGSWLMHLR